MSGAHQCEYCHTWYHSATYRHDVHYYPDGRYSHCFTSQKRSGIDAVHE